MNDWAGFSHAEWAFTRYPLTQSLTKLSEVDEKAALDNFRLVLIYSGLLQSSSNMDNMAVAGAGGGVGGGGIPIELTNSFNLDGWYRSSLLTNVESRYLTGIRFAVQATKLAFELELVLR